MKCALITIDNLLYYSKAHGFIALTKHYKEVKKEIENYDRILTMVRR